MPAEINVNAGKVPAWYYIAGAGGVFVAYTLYKRLSGSKAAPAPATSTSTPVVAAGSYGSDYSGAITNLQQSIDELNKSQKTSPSSTTSAAAITAGAITGTKDNQTYVGSGWVPNATTPQKTATPVSSNNHVYTAVADIFQAVTTGAQNLYYQPLPGLFSPIPNGSVNSLSAGTPLFRQVV
jgi:hypothetical protein